MPETFTEVQLRYDGLDAEAHQIDLNLLGQSLQGAARILAVTGHFAATGEYAKQFQALDVKVFVREPRANCYSLNAVLEFAKDQQVLAGAGAVILGPLITWIIAKASNNRTEMKALKDSLDKAIAALAGQNTDVIPKMLATIDKMAESLRPAVVQAVTPVGKSCNVMRIGDSSPIDRATAEAIRAERADEVTEERSWAVKLTELDLETAAGKVRLSDSEDEDDSRIRAIITDPSIRVPGNQYVAAFAAHAELHVRAKAILRQGAVYQLFISDIDLAP